MKRGRTAAYYYAIPINSPYVAIDILHHCSANQAQTAANSDLAMLFVSLELSKSKWLATVLAPGGTDVQAHCHRGRLGRPSRVAAASEGQSGGTRRQAGQNRGDPRSRPRRLLGARLLEKSGVESHVVDPASVAVPRRKRPAKSDRIDGEMLLRTLTGLQAWRAAGLLDGGAPKPRGRGPTAALARAADARLKRVQHTNRIRGMLIAKASRTTIRCTEADASGSTRCALPTGAPCRPTSRLHPSRDRAGRGPPAPDRRGRGGAQRAAATGEGGRLGGGTRDRSRAPDEAERIGAEFASVLWFEAFFRHFDNQRQLSAFAGLAPSPWKSGKIDREQGISQAGNPRLRTTAIELAWMWLRHQPSRP